MDIVTPLKQLKGFKKVFIGKGKDQQIGIDIEKDELRIWDEKQNKFVTPKGNYTFMIGASSEDIRLKINWLNK